MAVFELSRLLKNGYFPKELPGCFNSSNLADEATLVLRATECTNPKNSNPLFYSGFKSEMSRRRFAIPNPYHFCKAAKTIVDGEREIKEILEKSKYSLRAPIAGRPLENDSYAMRSSNPTDTEAAIVNLYQNNRIEIRLDINSFFDSIYTHTIPWAMHGIKTAKKKPRDPELIGNQLDSSMQAMNYSQTNGVLIGNDLSRIISEIILCTIDAQIRNRFPELQCCRFVDDYYIYIKNSNDVQQIIAFIRGELSKYQLNLNESKIQVNESPFCYGKLWMIEMKQAIRLGSREFLLWLVNKYSSEKDPALLKYGLKVIDARRFSPQNRWNTMQSMVLNVWVRYPFLAESVLPLLWNNKKQLKKSHLKNAIYAVIDQSILLKHDLELVWAVWFAKVFDIQLSQKVALEILRSENDLAIIILLDILDKLGLSNKPSIKKEYSTLITELKEADEKDDGSSGNLPWSSRWMLAYEIERENRLNSVSEELGIMKKDPFFKKLLKQGIKFYDEEYIYSEDQFEKLSTRNKRIKNLKERIKSVEFQNEIDSGNQRLVEQLMEVIEEVEEY